MLSDAQIAMIDEQMSALSKKIASRMPMVEGVEFVTQKRFDRILLEGLRLPHG